MKKEYCAPEMTLIRFGGKDMILTSGCGLDLPEPICGCDIPGGYSACDCHGVPGMEK